MAIDNYQEETPEPEVEDGLDIAMNDGSEIRKFIRYRGTSDRRIVSVETLQTLGLEAPEEDIVFDSGNDFAIEASTLSQEIQDLLVSQSDIIID